VPAPLVGGREDRILQETYAPGMSVSLVARQHGIAPNQLFSWRRLYAEGALSAVGAGEEVVPASEYRALQHQVRELQRLLGKKTLEGKRDPARGAGSGTAKKTAVAVALARSRGCGVKTLAEAIGVARSNLVVQVAAERARQRRGRRPAPEEPLLSEIGEIIAGQPTYGYRRVHALLRRRRAEQDAAPVNVKRISRVMRAYGLLLQRQTGGGEERRHDGWVAVDRSDTRWCSDGFEIGCDNIERVRLAFTLDRCDRQAIAWTATTGGIDADGIRLPDDMRRQASLRAGGPAADGDRMAVRQRIALYRTKDSSIRRADRSDPAH
jgi:transposase-like protein